MPCTGNRASIAPLGAVSLGKVAKYSASALATGQSIHDF